MITKKEYEKLRNELVWIKFCYIESNLKSTKDSEKNKIEYEPILSKFGDIILMTEDESKYDDKLSIDGIGFKHIFEAQSYVKIEKIQKTIISELEKLGHGIIDNNIFSSDYVWVKPIGEPEESFKAPLIEVWIGENQKETLKLGSHTGKTFSQKQINEINKNIKKITKKLNGREIYTPEIEEYNPNHFNKIAQCLNVEEGELVWKLCKYQKTPGGKWKTEEIGLSKINKSENGKFELIKPFEFPKFSEERYDLKEVIEDADFLDTDYNFELKNGNYIIKPSERTTTYDIKIVTEVYPANGQKRYMVEEQNLEVVDYSEEDVEKSFEVLIMAKNGTLYESSNEIEEEYSEDEEEIEQEEFEDEEEIEEEIEEEDTSEDEQEEEEEISEDNDILEEDEINDVPQYIESVKSSNRDFDMEIQNAKLKNRIEKLELENSRILLENSVLEEYKKILQQNDKEIMRLKQWNQNLYGCIKKVPKFIRKIFIKTENIKLLNDNNI